MNLGWKNIQVKSGSGRVNRIRVGLGLSTFSDRVGFGSLSNCHLFRSGHSRIGFHGFHDGPTLRRVFSYLSGFFYSPHLMTAQPIMDCLILGQVIFLLRFHVSIFMIS